jgi:hypothetical protein
MPRTGKRSAVGHPAGGVAAGLVGPVDLILATSVSRPTPTSIWKVDNRRVSI